MPMQDTEMIELMCTQFTLVELMTEYTRLASIPPEYRSDRCIKDIQLYNKAVVTKLTELL